MKKLLSICFAVAISLWAIPVNASTMTNSQIKSTPTSSMSPQYIQICEVDNGLIPYGGNTLEIYAATIGYSDADSCTVKAYLQKKSGSSWSNYKTWTATSPSSHRNFINMDILYTVPAGTYRLLTTHYVTVGTFTEFEYMESDEVTVS